MLEAEFSAVDAHFYLWKAPYDQAVAEDRWSDEARPYRLERRCDEGRFHDGVDAEYSSSCLSAYFHIALHAIFDTSILATRKLQFFYCLYLLSRDLLYYFDL